MKSSGFQCVFASRKNPEHFIGKLVERLIHRHLFRANHKTMDINGAAPEVRLRTG